jgi:hypothetical protein
MDDFLDYRKCLKPIHWITTVASLYLHAFKDVGAMCRTQDYIWRNERATASVDAARGDQTDRKRIFSLWSFPTTNDAGRAFRVLRKRRAQKHNGEVKWDFNAMIQKY